MPQGASLTDFDASNQTLRDWAHFTQLLVSRGPYFREQQRAFSGAQKYLFAIAYPGGFIH
jgi:hypothetical protein